MNFSQAVHQSRWVCRLTQEELARRVGLSRQSIMSIEQGTTTTGIDNALKIAQVLGIDLNVLRDSSRLP